MKKNEAAITGVVATVAGFSLVAWLKGEKKEKPQNQPTQTDAEKIVSVAKNLLPEKDSVLQEPDPIWDWILGGRIGNDRWNLYQWATGSKYGTTCGIFVAACMVKAGWSKEMINRDEPEGSGYKATKHIARIYSGAQKLGFVLNVPTEGIELKPGDIYCQIRKTEWQGKIIEMEHVGIVLNSRKNQDGSYTIETADGGQTAKSGRQCAKRVTRSLRGDQIKNEENGAVARLAWIVRTTKKGELVS
jgi:hypothetical protein